MKFLPHLFDQNRAWAKKVCTDDPEFFKRLSAQQTPEYLWIGCADSRVPANQIVDLLPGQIFVHRNIANVVVHSDLNCLSVLQYAVDILKVSHIIVCGHYGCGGVIASTKRQRNGLVDNWLGHLRDVRNLHAAELNAIEDEKARIDRFCELNVIEQAANICRTTIVEDAWAAGRNLAVHGWIYNIHDGLLKDLAVSSRSEEEFFTSYAEAIRKA